MSPEKKTKRDWDAINDRIDKAVKQVREETKDMTEDEKYKYLVGDDPEFYERMTEPTD